MSFRVLPAALAAALFALGASAETPATPTTVAPAVVNGQAAEHADTTATAPPTADPVICKYNAATTGSRLGGSKVCLKRSQWEDNRRAAREILDNSVRGSDTTNCTPTLGNGGGC